MSLINGEIERRRAVLARGNLVRNPFVKTDPPPHLLDRVFVGREQELRDAASRVVDHARNLLVIGGYGYGKTTFVRKLLAELAAARNVRFLTGYAPLRHDSPQGLQLAALGALVEGALAATEPDQELNKFASDLRQELARLRPEDDALRSPDLRFRDGLALARAARFDRVVLAVDEIDKRDAQVVQSILLGSRYFLDLDASFVLTGRYLDVFSDIRSSLLAVFDHRVDLRPFSDRDAAEIVGRNLAAARPAPGDDGVRPFEDETVRTIVAGARGLPRPLNLMAYAALEEALRDALVSDRPGGAWTVTVGHLDRALRAEGNLIFNEAGAQARELLARVFRRAGYVSGADLDALAPTGGLPEALRGLEDLARRDAILPLEASEGPAFALSPPMQRSLEALREMRERLRAQWDEARAATDAHVRGKAFEAFAADFFGEAFAVRERNARTDTEELDLVLEAGAETDPRFRKAPYLVVECKNWRSTPVDQTVVSKLGSVLGVRHLKQAFLVTTGEVTRDAAKQAENLAMAMETEIVVIDGDTMETFLNELRPVGDFLAELHRKQTLRIR